MESSAKVAVTESAIMNTQAAVFGICNPETGYGSGPGGVQGYPVASEHLAAFYGAGGGGSSGGSSAASSGGGGGASSGEPSSPSPYGSGSSGAGQGAGGGERHLPETKYEPSHSPSSGLISSDNGLQYANLDGSELKGYPGYPGSGSSHPHQAYQAHHSLVQATYAHHYGKGRLSIKYLSVSLHFKLSPFPIARVHEMLSLSSADCWTLKV